MWTNLISRRMLFHKNPYFSNRISLNQSYTHLFTSRLRIQHNTTVKIKQNKPPLSYYRSFLFLQNRFISVSRTIYNPISANNENKNNSATKIVSPIHSKDSNNSNKDISELSINANLNLYQKFKSNIKWILIRNKERPFSKDELGTLFSWLILSQVVWVILKTTTFVSLLLLAANTIFAKELVAETIGKLLNYFIDGIDVKFQDALIPKWKNGLIRFNNVDLQTSKDQSNNSFSFDLNFQQIEMNLSLKKWLLGKGLINNVKIYGMNGTTNIIYPNPHLNNNINKRDPTIGNTDSTTNAALNKNDVDTFLLINWFSNPYYQLNNIKIADSNITVNESYANGDPSITYKISLFNLEIPKLRFNQMIVDFLHADVISGSINNSLFTFHKRQQKIGYSNNNIQNDLGNWKRTTRLRLNSISIKDLGLYKTKSFNWMQKGNVDIVADIMLPTEDELNNSLDFFSSKHSINNNSIIINNNEEKYIVIDLKFIFKDLKAVLPINPPKLSTGEELVSLDELKPIVSYINLQRALKQFQSLSDNNNDDKITAHTILFRDSPEISIRRKRKYPDMSIIKNNSNSKHKQYINSNTNIQEKENNISKKGTSTVSISTEGYNSNVSAIPTTNATTTTTTTTTATNTSELALRVRLVRNLKSLENKILFQETGIYDQISTELYVDLIKIVEEWEYKNKEEWLKKWGNGIASQLLLYGFASPV
ncbi:Mdm32p PWA37_002912 [Arxiozyma heterogenica]|uniref:Mdm32p n=1 Tax=Arxiozyma heterogenica TaxID=278026 RepID=UPI002EEF4AD8